MNSDIKSEVKFQDSAEPPPRMMSKSKTLPKDGQVMVAILKDMGVNECEPRVVNQLLEFAYRYATNILEDSKMVSQHAKKKSIDLEDVKLAVEMYTEQNLTVPPSREVLLDMARVKNSTPLPIPKPLSGLRLPPDRHCLTACNYRVKYRPKPRALPNYGIKPGSYPMTNSSSVMPGYMPTGGNNSKMKMNQMPQIQIQPQQPQQQQPVFQISVNPQTMQTVTHAVKRKAPDHM